MFANAHEHVRVQRAERGEAKTDKNSVGEHETQATKPTGKNGERTLESRDNGVLVHASKASALLTDLQRLLL